MPITKQPDLNIIESMYIDARHIARMEKMHIRFWSEILKGRCDMGDIDVGGRITLKVRNRIWSYWLG